MYADHEESRRGADPATVSHEVDEGFWEVLDCREPVEDQSLPADITSPVKGVDSFELDLSCFAAKSIESRKASQTLAVGQKHADRGSYLALAKYMFAPDMGGVIARSYGCGKFMRFLATRV